MIDRTELDLRFDAQARMARALGGQGWAEVAVLPLRGPRAALAAALVRLAARLAPTSLTTPTDRDARARPAVA